MSDLAKRRMVAEAVMAGRPVMYGVEIRSTDRLDVDWDGDLLAVDCTMRANPADRIFLNGMPVREVVVNGVTGSDNTIEEPR